MRLFFLIFSLFLPLIANAGSSVVYKGFAEYGGGISYSADPYAVFQALYLGNAQALCAERLRSLDHIIDSTLPTHIYKLTNSYWYNFYCSGNDYNAAYIEIHPITDPCPPTSILQPDGTCSSPYFVAVPGAHHP